MHKVARRLVVPFLLFFCLNAYAPRLPWSWLGDPLTCDLSMSALTDEEEIEEAIREMREKHKSEKEIEEVIARVKRIRLLEFQAEEKRGNTDTLDGICNIYERKIKADFHDRKQMWREAIQEYFASLGYKREIDPSHVPVPAFVDPTVPPDGLEHIAIYSALAPMGTNLAAYRWAVSSYLGKLPTNEEITQQDPELLGKAVAKADKKFQDRHYFDEDLYKGPPVSALELAEKAMENPKLSPALRQELEQHVSFIRKFGATANLDFRNFAYLCFTYPNLVPL
jgi:hypothetical protein